MVDDMLMYMLFIFVFTRIYIFVQWTTAAVTEAQGQEILNANCLYTKDIWQNTIQLPPTRYTECGRITQIG